MPYLVFAQWKQEMTAWQANGGEIVPLEKQADIKIVDGARKEALPGTYGTPYCFSFDSLDETSTDHEQLLFQIY